MATMAEVIAGYRKLRERKAELKARHTVELTPINDTMKKMEAWLQRELNTSGATSAGTPEGTAYLVNNASVVVEDWSAALDYVKENELWGLLEHRISKTAVEELFESAGEFPPGVRVTRTINVRIRK